MIRIISAALLAAVVSACASSPPRYEYAVAFPVPATQEPGR